MSIIYERTKISPPWFAHHMLRLVQRLVSLPYYEATIREDEPLCTPLGASYLSAQLVVHAELERASKMPSL